MSQEWGLDLLSELSELPSSFSNDQADEGATLQNIFSPSN